MPQHRIQKLDLQPSLLRLYGLFILAALLVSYAVMPSVFNETLCSHNTSLLIAGIIAAEGIIITGFMAFFLRTYNQFSKRSHCFSIVLTFVVLSMIVCLINTKAIYLISIPLVPYLLLVYRFRYWAQRCQAHVAESFKDASVSPRAKRQITLGTYFQGRFLTIATLLLLMMAPLYIMAELALWPTWIIGCFAIYIVLTLSFNIVWLFSWLILATGMLVWYYSPTPNGHAMLWTYLLPLWTGCLLNYIPKKQR